MKCKQRPNRAGWYLSTWLSMALLVCTPLATVRADESNKSLATVIPSGALAYAELSDLSPIIDRIQRSAYLDLVLQSDQWKNLQKGPQYRRFEAGKKAVEQQLGMDAWTAVKRLIGGRVAAGMYPKEGSREPNLVGVIRSDDASAMTGLRERVENLLVLALADQIEVIETIEEVAVRGVDGKVFYAGKDAWLVVSNDANLARRSVRLLVGQKEDSLANEPSFIAAKVQGAADTRLIGYFDAERVRQAIGRFIPEKSDNPLGVLLFGHLVEGVAKGKGIVGRLDIGESSADLRFSVNIDPKSLGDLFKGFFLPAPEKSLFNAPYAADTIAVLAFRRDLAELYQNRERLVVDRLLSEFDKFEGGIANLLPGKDFGTDVLPLLGKELAIVVAPQDYSFLEGKPGVQLPGFAIVSELAKPQEASDLFKLVFQTVVAIANFEVAKNGGQPMVNDGEQYEGVLVSFGKHLSKPTGTNLAMVFNYSPAAARVENRFIMSSALSLCKQLIATLQAKPTTTVASDLILRVHASPLADILSANEQAVLAGLIRDGRTPEDARRDLELILKVIRYFKSVELDTGSGDDTLQLRLGVNWKS